MLTINKSITLNGTSTIKTESSEIIAVSMSANISETGTSNIVNTIINKDVYEKNKEECRADMDAFTTEVRTIEDGQVIVEE